MQRNKSPRAYFSSDRDPFQYNNIYWLAWADMLFLPGGFPDLLFLEIQQSYLIVTVQSSWEFSSCIWKCAIPQNDECTIHQVDAFPLFVLMHLKSAAVVFICLVYHHLYKFLELFLCMKICQSSCLSCWSCVKNMINDCKFL